MDGNCWMLRAAGYDIVWLSGSYCRACHCGRDVLLRWNGEDWIVV